MAVQFDGGVVLGADSRTSTGAYVANRVSDKLTYVHDRILCCRSGSAADTQAVADIVHYYLQLHAYVQCNACARAHAREKAWAAKTARTFECAYRHRVAPGGRAHHGSGPRFPRLLFRRAAYGSVQHGEDPDVATAAAMFQQLCYSNKERLSAAIIVAGWDKHSGGAVYNIPLGGAMHKQPFAIGGTDLARARFLESAFRRPRG